MTMEEGVVREGADFDSEDEEEVDLVMKKLRQLVKVRLVVVVNVGDSLHICRRFVRRACPINSFVPPHLYRRKAQFLIHESSSVSSKLLESLPLLVARCKFSSGLKTEPHRNKNLQFVQPAVAVAWWRWWR